jgi:hypothetical protein
VRRGDPHARSAATSRRRSSDLEQEEAEQEDALATTLITPMAGESGPHHLEGAAEERTATSAER